MSIYGSAAAGAGAGLVGGALGSGLSFLGQKNQEDFARKVMKHQIRWRARDMRHAGINPILAARPGGMTGSSVGGVQTGGMGASMTAGMAAGADMVRARTQRDLGQSQMNVNSQTIAESKDRAEKFRAEATHASNAADLAAAQKQRLDFENVVRSRDAEFYDTKWGKRLRNVERVLETFRGVIPNFFLGTNVGGGDGRTGAEPDNARKHFPKEGGPNPNKRNNRRRSK